MQEVEIKKEIDKYKDNYWMLNHWLEATIAGVHADVYFQEKGYKTIAIYGMKEMASRLMEDLGRTNKVQVLYGIDRDIANTIGSIENILAPNEILPVVDVIVVTPIHAYKEIEAELKTKCDYDIVSLEEVVWSL